MPPLPDRLGPRVAIGQEPGLDSHGRRLPAGNETNRARANPSQNPEKDLLPWIALRWGRWRRSPRNPDDASRDRPRSSSPQRLRRASPRPRRAASVCTGTCFAAPAGSGPLLVFTGHGWGHGVGMSQYGAYGYAQHGWTAQQILAPLLPRHDRRRRRPSRRCACCSPTRRRR